MSEAKDAEEMRLLGRLFGVTDPDASAGAIGEEITSQYETLRNALLFIRDSDGYESWAAMRLEYKLMASQALSSTSKLLGGKP